MSDQETQMQVLKEAASQCFVRTIGRYGIAPDNDDFYQLEGKIAERSKVDPRVVKGFFPAEFIIFESNKGLTFSFETSALEGHSKGRALRLAIVENMQQPGFLIRSVEVEAEPGKGNFHPEALLSTEIGYISRRLEPRAYVS